MVRERENEEEREQQRDEVSQPQPGRDRDAEVPWDFSVLSTSPPHPDTFHSLTEFTLKSLDSPLQCPKDVLLTQNFISKEYGKSAPRRLKNSNIVLLWRSGSEPYRAAAISLAEAEAIRRGMHCTRILGASPFPDAMGLALVTTFGTVLDINAGFDGVPDISKNVGHVGRVVVAVVVCALLDVVPDVQFDRASHSFPRSRKCSKPGCKPCGSSTVIYGASGSLAVRVAPTLDARRDHACVSHKCPPPPPLVCFVLPVHPGTDETKLWPFSRASRTHPSRTSVSRCGLFAPT